MCFSSRTALRLSLVTLALRVIPAAQPLAAQEETKAQYPDTSALREVGAWLSSHLPSYGSFNNESQGWVFMEIRLTSASLEADFDLMEIAMRTASAPLLRRACVLKVEGWYRTMNFDGSTARSGPLEPSEIVLGGLDPPSIDMQRWQPTDEMRPGPTAWAVITDRGAIRIDTRVHAEQVAERLRKSAELCGGQKEGVSQ